MLKNKNYGFTLFEFLAFLFLLVIITVIGIPFVIEKIDDYQKSSLIKMANKITKEVEKRYSGEKRIYTYKDKKETSIEKLNYKGFKPQNGMIIVNDNGEISLAFHQGKYCVEKKHKETKLTLSTKSIMECKVSFVDNSGASIPVLKDGMIPIVWDGSKWIKADISEKWYDYDAKKWANAVLVSEAMRFKYIKDEPGTPVYESDILAYFVWIPRYRYK